MSNYYNIVIFTASYCNYTNTIIDLLDPESNFLQLFQNLTNIANGINFNIQKTV